MKRTNPTARTALMVLLASALAACGGASDEPSPSQDDATATGMTGMEGMPARDMGAVQMDPATMQRHAQEMDSMVAEMRQHVQTMRQLEPDEWHARMGEHVPRVGGMLGMIDRQMREMDSGMGMGAEQMGRMMGMTAEEHRRMLDEMQTLRTEAEQIQTAPAAELRERMPAHLDRLDQMMATMEQSAAHLRTQ
jgi:hypothetical protein